MPWTYRNTHDGEPDEDSESGAAPADEEKPEAPKDGVDSGDGGSYMKWGLWKDVLVILVIPLAIWGVRLEVTRWVQAKEIEVIQKDLQEYEDEIKDISLNVQQNSQDLAVLNSKIEDTKETVDEINDVLRSR